MFSKDLQRMMKMYVKMRDKDARYLKRVSLFLKQLSFISDMFPVFKGFCTKGIIH